MDYYYIPMDGGKYNEEYLKDCCLARRGELIKLNYDIYKDEWFYSLNNAEYNEANKGQFNNIRRSWFVEYPDNYLPANDLLIQY